MSSGSFLFFLGGSFRDMARDKVAMKLGSLCFINDARKNTFTFDLAGPPFANPPTLQLKDPLPQHILLATHHA